MKIKCIKGHELTKKEIFHHRSSNTYYCMVCKRRGYRPRKLLGYTPTTEIKNLGIKIEMSSVKKVKIEKGKEPVFSAIKEIKPKKKSPVKKASKVTGKKTTKKVTKKTTKKVSSVKPVRNRTNKETK